MTEVWSTVSREDVEAMREILKRLLGTHLAPTGDIEVTIGGVRYVIKEQQGEFHAAIVER